MKTFRIGKKVFAIAGVGLSVIAAMTVAIYISNTPRNIDVQPLQQIRLSYQFTGIEEIASEFGVTVTYEKGDHDRSYMVARLPKDGAKNAPYEVYRRVNIIQFGTKQSAQKAYISHKKTFAETGYGRLYEEGGIEDNRYFTAYEPVHFDYNHGIPCGIVSSPHVTAVFLKNNILIVVSYTGYRNYDNYVREMNEDIAYVGEMLKNLSSLTYKKVGLTRGHVIILDKFFL